MTDQIQETDESGRDGPRCEQRLVRRPETPGSWWTRPDSSCMWRVVEIEIAEGQLLIEEMGHDGQEILPDCPWWEWAGPIAPPNVERVGTRRKMNMNKGTQTKTRRVNTRCLPRLVRGGWRYTRRDGVSKWTNDCNCWVTKYDLDSLCCVGIYGKRMHAWMIESPKKARKHVDDYIRDFPPNVKWSEPGPK